MTTTTGASSACTAWRFRHDLYLAAGGLEHRYGRFAEMLLAAALRDAGHQLGYARESIVAHHYRETLQELIDGTDEYVASECVYRAANPGPDRVGHSYLPDMPNPFSPGSRALDRDITSMLLAGTVGRDTRVMREAINGAGRVLAGFLGRRGPVVAAWLAAAACRARCWWNRHDSRRVDQPYRELVRLASVLSRVRFLASQPVIDSLTSRTIDRPRHRCIARVGTSRLPRARTDERSTVPMVEAHRRDSAPPEAWRLSTPPHHWRNPSREIESSRRVQRHVVSSPSHCRTGITSFASSRITAIPMSKHWYSSPIRSVRGSRE